MKLKWFINTTAIALLIFVALLGLAKHDSVMAAQDEGNKIEGLLLDRFTTDGNADFIVRFTEQADLSAAQAMDWNARGEFVYNTLRDVSANSQVNAKGILDTGGFKYQTFINGNELYVWGGTLTVASEVALLPEVSFIRATRTYYIDPVTIAKPLDNIVWAGDFLAKNTLTTVGNSPDATTDWGIIDTKADQFWTTFGLQGDGIVVANIDTGVQWNHPALDQAFKCGVTPSDPACWADPSNICGGSACDNNGHGTHTMGTMVGDDDPSLTYIVGMAPNAQWIACKGCESSSCSDYALNTCADWIVAPNGDPLNRPNVVNNSWGGGGGDNWYLTKVQAWVAAGVFPAFSAGNNYTCSSLGSPGDYQESFASASHTSNRSISDFSSKGPSAFGHDPYTKPNISAPGSDICSTVPGNGWNCGYSGTSMASPHSAGAVALLWSCNPGLVGQIDLTFQALQDSANTPPAGTCGAPPDGEGNYTFGYGYLDVLAAGAVNCGGVELGTLEGHVYDQDSNPVEGATVTAQPVVAGNGINATTDPTGFYTMDLVVGTYDVTASKANYTPQTVTGVVITVNQTTTQDFNIAFQALDPDIAVDPMALSATLLPDATTTITLTVSNNGNLPLDWNITEVPAGVGFNVLPEITGNKVDPLSRSAPEIVGRPAGPTHNGNPLAIMIDEGFEGGVIPPTDWTVVQTNPRQTWKIGLVGTPYEGTYFADVEYDDQLETQDELLLTPELDISNGVLDFWSLGSLYWCRDTYDNCDLNIWIVVGDWDGGTGDDIFVGKADDAWTNSWEWSNSTFDLATLLPGGPVRLGFQYTGLDGAQIGLDAIVLDVNADVPWLSEDPTSGMIIPGGSTQVDVIFNSTGLMPGEYLASLDVSSNDPATPVVSVPVTMTVVENARVAVAHLAPFAMDPGTTVTITLNGTPALTDFAFADSTAYIDLFPGEYLVEVWPMGAVEPAITTTVDLVGGTDYSVVAIGDADNQPLELRALEDNNTPPAAGKFHLRLGHLAPFAATGTEADICLQDGTPILTDVPYGDVAPYLPLDAGTYDLVIAAAGTDCGAVLIDPMPVTFTEGQIVTAFAVGNGTLQILGVFAWPSGAVGFLLPLEEGYTIFLPMVFKGISE